MKKILDQFFLIIKKKEERRLFATPENKKYNFSNNKKIRIKIIYNKKILHNTLFGLKELYNIIRTF